MKQMIGSSKSGDLKEALKEGKITSPALLVLMSNADQFEEHVAQLETAFPGVPSIQYACKIHKAAAKGFGKDESVFEQHRMYQFLYGQ